LTAESKQFAPQAGRLAGGKGTVENCGVEVMRLVGVVPGTASGPKGVNSIVGLE